MKDMFGQIQHASIVALSTRINPITIDEDIYTKNEKYADNSLVEAGLSHISLLDAIGHDIAIPDKNILKLRPKIQIRKETKDLKDIGYVLISAPKYIDEKVGEKKLQVPYIYKYILLEMGSILMSGETTWQYECPKEKDTMLLKIINLKETETELRQLFYECQEKILEYKKDNFIYNQNDEIISSSRNSLDKEKYNSLIRDIFYDNKDKMFTLHLPDFPVANDQDIVDTMNRLKIK